MVWKPAGSARIAGEPNSVMACRKATSAPASSAGSASGMVMLRAVRQALPPSIDGGVLQIAGNAVERVGDQHEDVGERVAGDDEDQPRQRVDVEQHHVRPAPVTARYSWFSRPLLGAASSSQAMAPRNGGVTNEAITRMRTAPRSGMSVRATIQPIGAATRQQMTLTEVAMVSVVSSGSTKAGSVNSVLEVGERRIARRGR